ncbi:MAG: hypothetical protein VKK63_01495 [Synechococcus sp.]|nr:hypothetical protein [Synechococcus sp.]
MSDFLKGVILMAGLIGQAIGAFFKENEALVANAKIVAGLAACQERYVQEASETYPDGESVPCVRWSIEFSTREDADNFERAIAAILEQAMQEGE